MLRNRIEELYKIVQRNTDYLEYNKSLLSVYKGELLQHVIEKMKLQFSGESLKFVIERIPPINVLKRIIDKESKIYAGGVRREVSGGKDSDQIIMDYFDGQIYPNDMFATWNAYFNLFKNGLVQPYLKSDMTPGARVIASDRFIPFSDDAIDCDNPTGHIICMQNWFCPIDKKNVNVYMAIDGQSFVYFTSEKRDVTAYFEPNSDGTNPVGVTPFVYINRDKENLMPVQDSDTFAMTVLIPILLADINYAHAFQAFSIMYGIDVDDTGLKIAPNAFWNFKSKGDGETKPQVGQLTPSADINGGLNLVANEFALWLNTRGIKPGAVGDVNGSNFSTGISKIMDEMDTSENRNEQIPYFIKGEKQFWDLTLKKMLPFWQSIPGYNGIKGVAFTPTASIKTTFSEQIPLMRRGQLIDDCKKEIDAGFTTKRRALKKLNPTMTEKEIDELENEIEMENKENDTTTDDQLGITSDNPAA